jgi:hypothetical protein
MGVINQLSYLGGLTLLQKLGKNIGKILDKTLGKSVQSWTTRGENPCKWHNKCKHVNVLTQSTNKSG